MGSSGIKWDQVEQVGASGSKWGQSCATVELITISFIRAHLYLNVGP